MVTVGLGEGLAIASLALELVEVGQKCAEHAEKWQLYSEDASKISIKFKHEHRRMTALKLVLTDQDKFGLDKPLFDHMEPGQQHDITSYFLRVLQLLKGFQGLASRLDMMPAQPTQTDSVAMLSSALTTQALEDALPELKRRDKRVQAATSFSTKWRWTFGGKTDAERLVSGIREWLTIIVEEIDLHFQMLPPKQTPKHSHAALPGREIGGDSSISALSQTQWTLLEGDPDLILLNLAKSMRIRKLVLQLEAEAPALDRPFPSHLMLKNSDVHVGKEIQSNRHIASIAQDSGRVEGFVEFRSSTRESDQVQRSMESLCMLLVESSEESFRLPMPEGIFLQEDQQRVGLFFPLQAIGADSLDSVWTLQKFLSPTERAANPSTLRIPPLEDRYKLALSLATAVCKLHSVGWYYQGLQSRNICLVLQNAGPDVTSVSFNKPFLFGFTKSRAMGDAVSYEDGDIVANLYRHSERWLPKPSKRHHALHDLYSLGVVLLEIGLWKDLSALLSRPNDPKGFDITAWKATTIQRHLIKNAEKSLAQVMGTRYQQIVLALLEAKPEAPNTSSSPWQSWPSQNRLLYAIAGLREICSAVMYAVKDESGSSD